jgi:hypothetical protein
MNNKLLLYELSCRIPVAEIDFEGHMNILKPSYDPPKILFANVNVQLHLTNGVTLAPMRYADDRTGPKSSVLTDVIDMLS